MNEIIVDNFAGGGGASTGIEMAIGRSVDIAINHDPAAIAMHRANHPGTKHYCESVWEVDPVKACAGRPVALAWFSPDCKHFSKAKGGKPVDKNIRGLAWVAVKWAKLVKPRVIMLENVEEFKTWGPLITGEDGNSYPDPERKGETFELFVKALQKLGYKVDFRELRACDYGAPTIRKRFFMIARCDNQPIEWPEPTHGDPARLEVQCGLLKPWRTAAEIIDWSKPCPSIFDRKKPLAENTLKRIARGLQKFVIENSEPFIVNYKFENEPENINKPLSTITTVNGHYIVTPTLIQTGYGEREGQAPRVPGLNKPLGTVVSSCKHAVVAPTLIQYHSETSDQPRAQTLDKPISTLDASPRYGLVSAFISKYYGGNYEGFGSKLDEPVHTVTSKDHNAVVTTFITQMNKSSIGQTVNEPLNTITAGANHFGEVRAFLIKYYSQGTGQAVSEPLDTVVSKDRFGLVTINGTDYQIVDIGLRMLEPYELFKAQGFPDDYIIDHDDKGHPYPKTAQVARCGNAVPPPLPAALVKANLPELCDEKSRYHEAG